MLVGRTAERRILDELVAGTRIGRSGVLVVTGEAGIGKTTLLDYAVEQAHGIDVTRIIGTESERDLAFGALALLLRPTLADLDHIPLPQARALRVALAIEDGEHIDRFAVGAATLSLLTHRAEEGPLALVLDDAHHLDQPSAAALAFAARRLLADPILVLAAVRSDEPSPLRTAGLPVLAVTGMDEPDTRSLLAGSQGGPLPRDLTTRVHQATGGNPLAILELTRDQRGLAALPDDSPLPVPAALAESFVRRVDEVGPQARTLLALCAAAGGDLRVVARASSELGIDLADLAGAEVAGLIESKPDRVRFTHPLIGSSIYASIPAARQRVLHAAIVEGLPASDLARRAQHRAAAALGPDDGAAAAVVAVADLSLRRGAYAVAAAGYERGAQLTVADDLRSVRLIDAAEAAWSAGDGSWAGSLVEAGMDLTDDSSVRGRGLAIRGAIAARSGSLDDARDLLLAAAREVSEVDPPAAVRLVTEAVNVAFYLADGVAATEPARLAESLIDRGVRGDAAGMAHLAIGMARVLEGGDGSNHIREGIQLLGAEEVRPSTEFDSTWLMMGALWLREDGATRRIVHAVEEARSSTAVGGLPHLLFHLARDGATTDRWAGAESDYSEAIQLAEELGQTTEEACSLAGLAWLEGRQGKEAPAREHADRALALAGPRHINVATLWARYALCELDLAAQRVDRAVEGLSELEAWLAVTGIRDVDMSPAPELVEVLLRSGDAQAARVVADQHASQARSKGRPWALARAERAAGLLGPDDELDEVFEGALRLHAVTPDVFETARTRLAYGGRLRRARRRVDARPQLRAALVAFERLGATPWAQTAADELEASGETAARQGDSGLEVLTPRERQIVSLLAEGQTTRGAAAALFLTPKTVEYHLRHVYTKLGIGSRTELTALVTASTKAT